MDNFPVEFIAELSKKEANGKKPIYAVHKWFGRKTDAIVRSILISMFKPKGNNFEQQFYSPCHNLLKGKVILDPFMGGGITLVNTLRMGGKAIGADINPTAWFITKNELQIPEIKKSLPDFEELVKLLSNELNKLELSVGEEIKSAYKTRIYEEDGSFREADIMYILWVKRVRCPECGNVTKLFPRYSVTNSKKEGFENINICPYCGELVRGDGPELYCGSCNSKFNVNISSYNSRKFNCKSCGKTFNIINDVMKKTPYPLEMDMYAIEYYDKKSGRKGFKKPDSYDIDNYDKIKTRYYSVREELKDFIPSIRIPDGFNTRQVLNHNYKQWSDMFNERQLLLLSKLLMEINNIKDQMLREIFLCIFSNTINANNMFCIYNSQCGKIEPLFGDHHLAPVMNPVENNIWGTKYGRGSFIKNYHIMLESKKYNYEPFERKYKGIQKTKVLLKEESFYGKFAEDFYKLKNEDFNTLIKCCSAEDLSFIPDGTIDGVVTDPPYYSAINYGEISEFFYSWERTILSKCCEEYKPVNISYNNEVTVNPIKGIEKFEFQKRLTNCFRELHRVLKPEAPLIFTYNNSSIDGWNVLLNSLKDSGFRITEVYPVYMEYKAGLVDNRRQKMSYDLIIHAVKAHGGNRKSITFQQFLHELNLEENTAAENYVGSKLNKLDDMLIKVGALYKLFFKYYPNIYDQGKAVEFEDIIRIVYQKS